jgi:hypothetical protein
MIAMLILSTDAGRLDVTRYKRRFLLSRLFTGLLQAASVL